MIWIDILMKTASQTLYLKNYIRSEFIRLKNDNILWLGIFIITIIVIIMKCVSFVSISFQVAGDHGFPIPFSERLPAYLAFIQSNYDMATIYFVLYLFILPLINSIVYASSISLEKKYGVTKWISFKLPIQTYYLGKLIVSVTLSFILFILIYVLDAGLTFIIYPWNSSGFFNQGDIFNMQGVLRIIDKLPENLYLFYLGIMIMSAAVYALLSAITCSLVFITKLKYPAILLSTTMFGLFSSLIFDLIYRSSKIDMRNLAIGRLPFFAFHINRGFSPLAGLLINVFAVTILVFCTYKYLQRAGDVF